MSDLPTDLPVEEPTQTAAPAAVPAVKKRRSKLRMMFLMFAVPLALAGGAGAWWFAGGRYESTENANLHQARVSIAPVIGGRVVDVAVSELQTVHKGDALFQVDPEPYRLALAQAEAALDGARVQVERLKAAYAQAVAQQKLARDDADFQQSELARQEALSRKGVSRESDLDSARHAAKQAAEQASVAEVNVSAARAALGGAPDAATDAHPTVRAALAELDRARYNLDQTTVLAPADGVIYQAASFRPGAMVSAGQSVFALVETGDLWVEANFKETQLEGIGVGQEAEISFDMAPGRKFAGKVEAIGAGTGAEFSLLPAQNATGNWVKVTQRIPVRIRLDDPAAAAGLSSGLSAEVTVDTGRERGPLFAALAGE
ncbi:MAG: hypothetical protein BGP11_06945 [Rhodobacterales bacterium 65-51]|uniref:HlyD family secretion protein n=1 Tax=uncultured Gemmobacter sp. TaxID=1095917 RepID=UPI0009671422|nr:HlyD family secretion protein [uncultured Gemmobacter sp.]OJY25508.1 MAG: hypothetical protein BGP11_06945 [Rhodobacterales bacterium 65-51]